MDYWRWPAALPADQLKQQVLVGIFERINQQASGPCSSMFEEVRASDRRQQPDRRREPARRLQPDRRRGSSWQQPEQWPAVRDAVAV